MGDDGRTSDVSDSDVTHIFNPLNPHYPTSEVGLAPTSLPQPQQNQRPLMDINNGRQQQNITASQMSVMPTEFVMQMMKTMQQMAERLNTPQETKVRINDIFLPSFDPDKNVGVREWCQHITKAVETYRLNDYDVRMKVGSLLKGRAKLWVDDWMVSTSSWEELKEKLITTYEPENRYSRDILKFREHVYDPSKDISEFLSRGWVLWKRITKDKLDDELAVEAVIGCIDDERIRIELLNAKATTVPELISVASSIRVKRPSTSSGAPVSHKRQRFNDGSASTLSCEICKRTNHTTKDCRFKSVSRPQEQKIEEKKDKDNSNKETSQAKPSCTFCSRLGHTYDTCFKRDRSLTSNVNFIEGSGLAPFQIKIGSALLQAVFDSGAECSVIRETVAAALPGCRIQKAKYLKGIGQFPVLSLTTLVTVCIVDDISVELEFFILPDCEMSTDVLVGMNLITGTDLSMIITSQGSRLLRQPVVNQLNCDLTTEQEIAELRTLLNKYEHLFIRGRPHKVAHDRRAPQPEEQETVSALNDDDQVNGDPIPSTSEDNQMSL